jgi:hypothetical protein
VNLDILVNDKILGYAIGIKPTDDIHAWEAGFLFDFGEMFTFNSQRRVNDRDGRLNACSCDFMRRGPPRNQWKWRDYSGSIREVDFGCLSW